VAVGAAALLTTGCLSSGDSGDSGGSSGDNTSKNIEIMTGFSGDQFEFFKAEVDPYAKSQGITIKWSPAPNFNQLIVTRVQGRNLPDIATFPQPGLLKDIAGRGVMAPLDDVVDLADLEANYTAGTLETAKLDGKLYGALISMNVKSLVFYPKKAFEAAGYTAPKTLDELQALTEKIKSDGNTPWCMGIESGPATGWPATDWMEDLILHQQGVDTYNKWVSHDIKFDSPEVKQAADYFAKLAFTDGNMVGGRKSIASNGWATSSTPMFKAKPGCFLFKQGNFVAAKGGFPDKVVADLDNQVGVFAFPPATAGGESPVLGGGDLAGLFSKDNEAAKTIIKFLTSKEFGGPTAQKGNFISPRKDFDQSNYPNEIVKGAANVAYEATTFAFDGSDLMPGAVGAGSFWKQMTSWISNQTSLDKALKAIDSSWPAS
jgi:alpha-glucoside transport system substrate-binding protein